MAARRKDAEPAMGGRINLHIPESLRRRLDAETRRRTLASVAGGGAPVSAAEVVRDALDRMLPPEDAA